MVDNKEKSDIFVSTSGWIYMTNGVHLASCEYDCHRLVTVISVLWKSSIEKPQLDGNFAFEFKMLRARSSRLLVWANCHNPDAPAMAGA